MLCRVDEDLTRLFKVRADFAGDMAWDDAGVATYARLAAHRVAEDGLPPFAADAVARLVERLAPSRGTATGCPRGSRRSRT